VTTAFIKTERADQLHHDDAPAHSTALVQTFLEKHHITHVCQTPTPSAQIWLPEPSGFPKAKNKVEREEICECDGHKVNKLSQWCLTAE